MRISLPLAFGSPREDRGGAPWDAPPRPQGGQQGEDTTTPPPLHSPLGSAGRAAGRGCRWRALATLGRSGARRMLRGAERGSGCGCRGRTTVAQGRRRGGGRARHPLSLYLDALGGGCSGSPERGGGPRATPEGGGRGARRMCCLTLRRPLGSRSSGSQHFLSLPEPDTDSSREHPVCGARPAPGPRPPRPAPLPRERPPLSLSLTESLEEGVALVQKVEASRQPAEVNRSIPMQSAGLTPKLLQTEEFQCFGSSC